jgi:hypothetical protein
MVKLSRRAGGTPVRRITLRGVPKKGRPMSALVTSIGCGFVLAGFAAEKFAEHRWLAASRPAPLDALAVLALALPAVGLTLMATLAA